jgi:hypothetical protein
MNRNRNLTGFAVLAVLCMSLGIAVHANAQAAAATQDAPGVTKAPAYTMAEYNSYKACEAEAAPGAKIKCLDDFVAKYPNSALLNFVYPLYTQAYGAQKNYAKVMEYADKLAAMGDKATPAERFNGYYTHCAAYSAMIADPAQKVAAADPAIAKSAQTAALAGLDLSGQLKKPDNVADDAWTKQISQFKTFLNGVAATAGMTAKDCSGAIASYKSILAMNPDDAVSSYQLGRAYMCANPPQQMDAFWAIAHAVTSKTATQAQSAKVKDYLRKLIANYQGGTVCDQLTDAELNELLQLSGTSVDRPGSYTIASAADISAAQKDMNIASVVADLKAGGAKGKLTWLASCGLEFPDVQGKLIEVVPGTDFVTLKIAFVTSQADFEAATVPNMEVKVAGQPGVEKLEKDSAPRFTGTLVSYDPDPAFMLHWEKAKVNDEDMPKEEKKPAPKKPVARRPAVKKPA